MKYFYMLLYKINVKPTICNLELEVLLYIKNDIALYVLSVLSVQEVISRFCLNAHLLIFDLILLLLLEY